jgi:ABC-type antimicrobial peptide transport system permease subunit
MALGARRSQVLRLVLQQGLTVTTVGLAAGLLGAKMMTRYLQGMLFGLTPTDPLTFVAGSSVFALVAMLACYIPARRATKVDPLLALRYE